MGLIRELEKIIDGAENEYLRLKDRPPESGLQKEISCQGAGGDPRDHRIIHCDNLSFLAQGINSGQLREAFDLIYCDPPFFTKTKQEAAVEVLVSEEDGTLRKERLKQRAYSDLWNRDPASYLSMLAVRLFFLRDALKDTGSIFVHLDWHAVHSVKLLMDEIFGEKNFVNEIIWTYKSGGSAKRHYARKHDTILFYAKTPQYKFHETEKEKSYNRGLKPYHFKGVEEFQDEVGWYTLVNPKDVWQMDMLGRSAAERLRYATQKPEALLSKIIRAVTDPGDLCGDFFCGSGTLGAAAAALGRRSVCVDAGQLAVSNAMKRPLMRGTAFELWSCGKAEGPARDPAEAGGLPLRPGDMEKGRRLFAEKPEAFVDYMIEGSLDEAGCLHPARTVFRTAKGEIPYLQRPEAEASGPGGPGGAVLQVDVFGRRSLTAEAVEPKTE